MATCTDYALNYISRYPKTEQELKTKLFTKRYTEDEIDRTLAFLKKKGFLDDEKFARLYIQSEIVKKWKVPYLIKQKLLHKWIEKSTLDAIFKEYEDEMHEWIQERIRKEVDRLKKKGLDWYDIVIKIAQKGYRIQDIKNALK